ncbi:hypothetical protein PFMC_06038 [Plasmodium falciparum CAMP/Malaysia]|uniref:Uncharacterized protein n=1 Tax=Plasmodium falciparum (isolate Camp / Malaysia) TaxID=5835 RepID=A0A024WZ45_PLAFC|nr:hypothetical protein PFMC_06038 [Plasmodium falciparum CAMP/Malaysia]
MCLNIQRQHKWRNRTTTNTGWRMELDENSVTGGTKGPNESPSAPSDTPLLSHFISRPPYFRYLEEWGETFCKERKKRLKKIKEECRGVNNSGDPKYCSGDGYHCTGDAKYRNDNFVELDCSRCAEQCTYYKNWIKNKKNEIKKQKRKYEGELQKLKEVNSNDGDNTKFFKEIENRSFDQFLKALKHCKNDKGSEDDIYKEDKDNKIDFENIPQTFSRSTYCKACPIYGVTCNSSSGRRRSDHNPCRNNEPQKAANTVGEETPITILIDDGSNHSATNGATDGSTDGTTKDSYEELKNCSKKYSLFKGLIKQEWKCQKKKGVDQCKLKNFSDDIDDDEHIVFNEFFQR